MTLNDLEWLSNLFSFIYWTVTCLRLTILVGQISFTVCGPTGCFKKSSRHKTFWNIFTSVKSFCIKFCKFVGNSYPHISANFLYIYLTVSSNGVNFSMSTRRFHRVKFWVLNADASWARTWWESHHFQWYPDKGWKFKVEHCYESLQSSRPHWLSRSA